MAAVAELGSLGIPTMKLLLTLYFVVALLPLCSCALRSRSRQMIERFFTEPSVPSTYSTNALRLGYVVAYIEGFNSFMVGRGNRPDPYATWLTEQALAAERDGYLAGVAAAYDAWLHYSQTNAVRQK